MTDRETYQDESFKLDIAAFCALLILIIASTVWGVALL